MSEADKASLLAEIAESRRHLAATGEKLRAAADGMRQKLDVPARIASSLQKHRPAWLGGATLFGFLLSRLPARQKTVYVDEHTGTRLGTAGKLGMLWTLTKLAASATRPWLGELAGAKIADMARRFTSHKSAPPPQQTGDPQ